MAADDDALPQAWSAETKRAWSALDLIEQKEIVREARLLMKETGITWMNPKVGEMQSRAIVPDAAEIDLPIISEARKLAVDEGTVAKFDAWLALMVSTIALLLKSKAEASAEKPQPSRLS